MNSYLDLKKKHEEEFNEFPIAFAFSNKQFVEAMEKLGLTAKDTEQVCTVPGGGIMKKIDVPKLKEMWARQEKERQEARDQDKTGEGYILEMFEYELNNHEYGYTQDPYDTLRALGLTEEDIEKDPKLKKSFEEAKLSSLVETY